MADDFMASTEWFADSQRRMDKLYFDQGKFAEAEMYKRALAGLEKALGKDHPSTLNTAHNPVSSLHHISQYKDRLPECLLVLCSFILSILPVA